MRIEDITAEALGKADRRELHALRLRLNQLWGGNFARNAKQAAGELSRSDLVDKYKVLLAEFRRRGVPTSGKADLDRVLFKRAMFGGLDPSGIGELVLVPDYVCAVGGFVKNPRECGDLDLVVRDDRHVGTELKLGRAVEKQVEKSLHFVYNPQGPHGTHVPLFDLVLRPKPELARVAVAEGIAKFDPDQLRDEGGKWSETGAGGAAQREGLRPVGADVKRLADGRPIPPGWKNVYVNPDPSGRLQLVAEDAKGRTVRVYNKEFVAGQAEQKFSRVQKLEEIRDESFARARLDMGSEDPATREVASVAALVQATGIRPGSERDAGGKVQAYGATTLEGRHVKTTNGGTYLKFVGKKGVALRIPIHDPAVAADLRSRRAAVEPKGKIYKAGDDDLRDYVSKITDGLAKPKDFRTLAGTLLARERVAAFGKRASSAREYRKVVRGIAKEVAERLGNTPTVALQSYINPRVFRELKPEGMG